MAQPPSEYLKTKENLQIGWIATPLPGNGPAWSSFRGATGNWLPKRFRTVLSPLKGAQKGLKWAL